MGTELEEQQSILIQSLIIMQMLHDIIWVLYTAFTWVPQQKKKKITTYKWYFRIIHSRYWWDNWVGYRNLPPEFLPVIISRIKWVTPRLTSWKWMHIKINQKSQSFEPVDLRSHNVAFLNPSKTKLYCLDYLKATRLQPQNMFVFSFFFNIL